MTAIITEKEIFYISFPSYILRSGKLKMVERWHSLFKPILNYLQIGSIKDQTFANFFHRPWEGLIKPFKKPSTEFWGHKLFLHFR